MDIWNAEAHEHIFWIPGAEKSNGPSVKLRSWSGRDPVTDGRRNRRNEKSNEKAKVGGRRSPMRRQK